MSRKQVVVMLRVVAVSDSFRAWMSSADDRPGLETDIVVDETAGQSPRNKFAGTELSVLTSMLWHVAGEVVGCAVLSQSVPEALLPPPWPSGTQNSTPQTLHSFVD